MWVERRRPSLVNTLTREIHRMSRVWIRFSGRASVRVRIKLKDKTSMSRDNFL